MSRLVLLATYDPSTEPAVSADTPTTEGHQSFLSIAAHDLRGSIGNAHTFAEFLLGPKGQLEDRTRRGLESIRRSTDRALEQVQAVFDSLRAEQGALALELNVQPVAPLLQEAVERARQAHWGPIEAHLPHELPWSKIDAEKLVSATAAFLHHAISRTPEQGSVRLEAVQFPEKIYVGVGDEGPRLSAAEHAQAFDREARVGRERGLREGFHLCLARDYLEAMGGLVGLSEGPFGMTFFFTLPSHPAHSQAC